MFFAEVAGHNYPRGETVTVRQALPIHLVNDERCRIQCLLQRDGVGVIIDPVEPHLRCLRSRRGCIKERRQRHAFPNSVTHESRIEAVADAHKRRLLRHGGQTLQVVESVTLRFLDEPSQFKPPDGFVYDGIDDILGHTIELFVRRDRLDAFAFVLQTIVTEGRGSVEFPQNLRAATDDEQPQSSQNQCTAADRRCVIEIAHAVCGVALQLISLRLSPKRHRFGPARHCACPWRVSGR